MSFTYEEVLQRCVMPREVYEKVTKDFEMDGMARNGDVLYFGLVHDIFGGIRLTYVVSVNEDELMDAGAWRDAFCEAYRYFDPWEEAHRYLDEDGRPTDETYDFYSGLEVYEEIAAAHARLGSLINELKMVA